MYIEGDLPVVSTGNSNSGMWGSDGIWAILLLALLGNRGFGFGGGFGSGGTYSEALGYELGKVATTNDVASGFNNSAVLSSLNDIKLGQSQMQNFINQGFAGINTSLLQGFNGVDNAICTLGYQTQTGFNSLGHQISDCCCGIKSLILENRYLNEKQTADLITNANSNTQRIIDFMQTEKINALTAENVSLKGQISNSRQTADIISQLRDGCPIPAYVTCNPKAPYYGYPYTFGTCGASVQ